jgi:hypothetical protein
VEPTDFKNVIIENIPPALSYRPLEILSQNENNKNSIMKSDKN